MKAVEKARQPLLGLADDTGVKWQRHLAPMLLVSPCKQTMLFFTPIGGRQ